MSKNQENTKQRRRVVHYIQGFVAGVLFVVVVNLVGPSLKELSPSPPLYTAGVTSLVFSKDGQVSALGSRYGTITLKNTASNQPIGQPLTGHTMPVTALAFSPDSQTLASGSLDGTIILWDLTTDPPISLHTLTGHEARVTSLAFSPDGQVLASGSNDRTIILWDMTTSQPISQTLIRHDADVNSVAFSPDGQKLASGSADGILILWDVATGRNIGKRHHTDRVLYSVAFSPDGQTLATGSHFKSDTDSSRNQGEVCLWNATTGERIARLPTRSKAPVVHVAFSPDSKMLASVSYTDTIILWDVATDRPVGQPLTGHPRDVISVMFTQDEMLASGSPYGRIALWDISNKTIQLSWCRRLGGWLGCEE